MATIETGILTSQGYRPILTVACTLGEAVEYEPEGVYTITRTYQRDKAFMLDWHLDRLEESARLENIPLNLDRGALRSALRMMIDHSGYAEARFRITVPRQTPNQIYLAMEPLNPISEDIRKNGVKTATIRLQRHNPIAKTTDWTAQRQQATANLSPEIYESILVNANGELLEGTSSNFYAILNGILRTAEEGILHGISRRVLLASMGDSVPLDRRPITLEDIPLISEAFLTSSSRAVIPIVEIDRHCISNTGGVITLELQRRYDAWTEAHLEPI